MPQPHLVEAVVAPLPSLALEVEVHARGTAAAAICLQNMRSQPFCWSQAAAYNVRRRRASARVSFDGSPTQRPCEIPLQEVCRRAAGTRSWQAPAHTCTAPRHSPRTSCRPRSPPRPPPDAPPAALDGSEPLPAGLLPFSAPSATSSSPSSGYASAFVSSSTCERVTVSGLGSAAVTKTAGAGNPLHCCTQSLP